MRNVVGVCITATLLASLGCTEGRWGLIRKETGGGGGPVNNDKVPSVESLVSYLNENASRTESVRCSDLSLTVYQGVVPVTLGGQMVCQRPKNFRLSAEMLGKTEVDLGSNQEEFWYWIKR